MFFFLNAKGLLASNLDAGFVPPLPAEIELEIGHVVPAGFDGLDVDLNHCRWVGRSYDSCTQPPAPNDPASLHGETGCDCMQLTTMPRYLPLCRSIERLCWQFHLHTYHHAAMRHELCNLIIISASEPSAL